MKSHASSSPLVWMNVTTSANWDRPAVGIVRVEQALCTELSRVFGNRFRRCVWMDDTFVEWSEDKTFEKSIDDAVDVLLPRVPTFDLARRMLAGRLAQFVVGGGQNVGLEPRAGLTASIPVEADRPIKPRAGDILISVGLDWDQPYHTEFYRLSKYGGLKIITCCYDLIPILFPQYCVGDVASRFKSYFDLVNWSSSAVLCISKQTQNDLINLWDEAGASPRLTKVIPLGDNVPSGEGSISSQVRELRASPFILFVSTIERRKNHETLYKAYHLLCRAGLKDKLPKLVFVGMPGWGVGDFLKDLELDPLIQGLVIQLNHVNDAELLELYKESLFCVYPSLYEGWGLPVGEALSLGKVVLSSDQGSLPEVGGDLVRYVPAWNPQAWADAILELTTHEKELERLAAKVSGSYRSRTWRDTAMAVAEVVDHLADAPETNLSLFAGYDFSTQCGMHVGSKIRATGEPGFLMYGPYLSLRPGKYSIEVKLSRKSIAKNGVVFEVTSDRGQVTHAKETLQSLHRAEQDGTDNHTLRLEIDLAEYVDELEIRCRTERGSHFDIGSVDIFK
jgi:glycosyltransferase involved in cell wall biosynthesis